MHPLQRASRATPRPLLIVSDVDGTLLDEQGCLPCTPRELRAQLATLAAARGTAVQVALASSRTLRELTVLQRAICLPGPCIAEDGALLAVETAHTLQRAQDRRRSMVWAGRRQLAIEALAADVAALEEIMQDMPAFLRADIRQLGVPEWRTLGFRTPASVRRALAARHFSVLLDPEILDADAVKQLHEWAARHALQLQRGGRWLTLTAALGKGAALRVLRHQLSQNGVPPLVAAIGNEENDLSLLAEADLRFVICNPHRGPLRSLASLPGAIVTSPEGPGGWIDMLNRLKQVNA